MLIIMLFIRSILQDQQKFTGQNIFAQCDMCATILSRTVHFAELQMWTFNLAASDSTPASIWLYCESTKLLWILLEVTPAIYVYVSIQYSMVSFVNIS